MIVSFIIVLYELFFIDVVVAPRRRFPSCFDIGKPNLVVVNPGKCMLLIF